MKPQAVILGILAFLDLLTTGYVLRHGGVELNPFMAGIGFIGMVIVRITFLIVIVWVVDRYIQTYAQSSPRGSYVASLVVYVGISALWLSAVLNNIAVIFT